MNAIQKCLKRLPDAPIGRVVHVQATDTDVLEWSLQHRASHVLLVASAEETLDALRTAAASRPEVEVIDAVVSGRDETLRWFRFNVREIDGPLEPAGLRQVYPRLRLLDQTERNAIDLPTALGHGPALGRGDRPHLLVLDVPGRELSVLAALTTDALGVFDWVLVRSAREGLYEGGHEPRSAHAHLDKQFFKLEEYDDRTDPLWPVALFRHDRSAAERYLLEQQLQSLQQTLATAERQHADEVAALAIAHTKGAKQLEELTLAAAVASSLAEQRKSQLDELTRARDELSKAAAETGAAQAAALAQARAEADNQLASTLKLSQARDDAIKQVSERQNRIAQLEAELQQARDVQAQRGADSEARLQELKAALAASEKLVQTHLASIGQLGKSRDEYAGQAVARQKQVSQLEGELADLAARQSMLQEELVKAEAHVELISDLLFREPLR